MNKFLIVSFIATIGTAHVSNAQLATPIRILEPEEMHLKYTVLEGQRRSEIRQASNEASHATSTERTTEGLVIPTRYFTPGEFRWPNISQPVFYVPSAWQIAQWQAQQRQAYFMASLRMPVFFQDPVVPEEIQTPPPSQSVILVPPEPSQTVVDVTPNTTTVIGIETLTDEMRASILEISRQAQEHDLKRLDLKLKDQAQRFERDKAFLLEEQRRTTLGLLGGGFGLAVFFLLMQYSGRKYLELLKDVKML